MPALDPDQLKALAQFRASLPVPAAPRSRRSRQPRQLFPALESLPEEWWVSVGLSEAEPTAVRELALRALKASSLQGMGLVVVEGALVNALNKARPRSIASAKFLRRFGIELVHAVNGEETARSKYRAWLRGLRSLEPAVARHISRVCKGALEQREVGASESTVQATNLPARVTATQAKRPPEGPASPPPRRSVFVELDRSSASGFAKVLAGLDAVLEAAPGEGLGFRVMSESVSNRFGLYVGQQAWEVMKSSSVEPARYSEGLDHLPSTSGILIPPGANLPIFWATFHEEVLVVQPTASLYSLMESGVKSPINVQRHWFGGTVRQSMIGLLAAAGMRLGRSREGFAPATVNLRGSLDIGWSGEQLKRMASKKRSHVVREHRRITASGTVTTVQRHQRGLGSVADLSPRARKLK